MQENRAMSPRRITVGILATAVLMLIALAALTARGGSSNLVRNAAIITFIVSAVPLGFLLAFRLRPST